MAASPILLTSSDRFCLIGKTRSGKTFATVLLATLLLPWQWPPRGKKPWQIWWIDTKGSTGDLKRLREWGFVPVARAPENWPRVLFKVRSLDQNDELSVAKQVQQLCWRATARGNVLIIIDEYVSCVMSQRSTGPGLKDVYQRGGGLHVGSIGGTQEPVGIPRQLASQATHTLLFNVTFTRDVEWCNDLCPMYGDGPPDRHGFFYRWLDGPKELSYWRYYSDINEFLHNTREQEQPA